MHNYRSNQLALMIRFGTDLRHQYGIFGGKSQTSFSRNATRVGSEEGRLFSQARADTGFNKGGSKYEPPKVTPCGSVRGELLVWWHLPTEFCFFN